MHTHSDKRENITLRTTLSRVCIRILNLRGRIGEQPVGRFSAALGAIGAIAFALLAYTPWFTGTFGVLSHSLLASSQIPLHVLPVNSMVGLPLLPFSANLRLITWRYEAYLLDYFWCLLTIGGVLLCPSLWYRGSSPLAMFGRAACFLWSVCTGLFSAIITVAVLAFPQSTRVSLYHFTSIHIDWGLPAAMLALLVTSISCILTMRTNSKSSSMLHRQSKDCLNTVTGSSHSRSGLALCSRITIMLGIALWSLGAMCMGWAVSGCGTFVLSLVHVYDGSCVSLDAGDSIGYFLTPTVFPSSTYVPVGSVILAIYLYLVLGACSILGSTWLRWDPNVMFGMRPVVIIQRALWLSWATLTTALALLGTNRIIHVSPPFGPLHHLTWQVGAGAIVALSGLTISYISVLLASFAC